MRFHRAVFLPGVHRRIMLLRVALSGMPGSWVALKWIV